MAFESLIGFQQLFFQFLFIGIGQVLLKAIKKIGSCKENGKYQQQDE